MTQQCDLCEVRSKKRLKPYKNSSKRAGQKPMDFMLCSSCHWWISRIMTANHGVFEK